MTRTTVALLLLLMLVGCGQKGDLYLPDQPTEQTNDQTEEDEDAR